jgi:UDP-N-acetylmuramoylalanine--D-glutamate ligase
MKDFKSKKVLVLGLGLNEGGVGSAGFFAGQGAEVRVTDLKDKLILKPSLDRLSNYKNIEYILGEHRNEDIDWADLIIRNPALKPDNKYLIYAKEKGKQIEMDVGIFLQLINPAQIVGVTGSKGKTTTASLIYYAVKEKYPNTILAGNIGKSVLDIVPHINKETLVVLELSSFQLEAFAEHKVAPNFAVITNIFPDHLNYYSNMEDYISAKKLIAKHQSGKDYLFLNKNDQILTSKEFLDGIRARIIYFSEDDIPSDFNPNLVGEHNKTNYAAALAVATGMDVEKTEALKNMNEFKSNEFRLQLVKEVKGIKIYNDSSSTNPNSSIAALKALPNSILIAGGMNKGLEYKDFAKAIEHYAKEVYFLIGDATLEIEKFLTNMDKVQGCYDNLEEILKDVKEKAKDGDNILFSPGATSFNLFQNEFDRGRKFNEAVKKTF